MDEEFYQNFDLSSLLQLGSIDVRKVARNDMALLTKDYFILLSKFLSRVPAAKENLAKLTVTNQKSEESPDDHGFIITNLENLRNALEVIGADHLFSLAAEIVKLSKRGNKNYIAEQAKKLITSIDGLCAQLVAAQKEKQADSACFENILNAENTGSENYETSSLHQAIKLLDHERANRKLEILAVDDAPIMLKTIASVLGDKYKVYGMPDPTMLAGFLKQITPDLFLLDYKMPELSGFDLIPIIRSFDKHKDTPIIFLTSSSSSEHVATALKLGACDYIVKPFQGTQLREKIAKHIAKKG